MNLTRNTTKGMKHCRNNNRVSHNDCDKTDRNLHCRVSATPDNYFVQVGRSKFLTQPYWLKFIAIRSAENLTNNNSPSVVIKGFHISAPFLPLTQLPKPSQRNLHRIPQVKSKPAPADCTARKNLSQFSTRVTSVNKAVPQIKTLFSLLYSASRAFKEQYLQS